MGPAIHMPHHALLLEHRPACLAQARLLPSQAVGDGAGVGDFAGAEAIDIRRAGPALLLRALRRCRLRRGQREQEAD